MHNTSLVTVYPSRITITPRKQKKSIESIFESVNKSVSREQFNTSYIANFKVKNNPFILSKASKRKLYDSINAMYCLSSPRNIEMKNKKMLYNFKMSFITLTLPSKQVHADKEIKQVCLNQFLVELRKHYGVKNYVWKAELQSNENIHFHLILDKYVDYQALRRRWNRILSKLGYITAYSNKFQKINLSQYHAMRNTKASCSFKKSKAAFAAGKKSNWSNPNTVDVRSVLNKKNLAAYLGKYLTKKATKGEISSELSNRQILFGRSWARSESLCKLNFKSKIQLDQCIELIKYLKSNTKKVKHFFGQWFDVFYFNVADLSASFKAFHKNIVFANARLCNYPFT